MLVVADRRIIFIVIRCVNAISFVESETFSDDCISSFKSKYVKDRVYNMLF